ILTIHAAKGLEWDSVAVVALSEGVLPGTAPRKDGSRASSRWLTDQGELPASMRADAVTLPNLQLFAGATHKDVDEAIAELK
ncbi:3'-5' exonuclease, partial [Streptococcus agalactiae]